MAEISVIVPIYNSICHLEQCIESILAQTFRDIEVILVDDGSNDGSEKICDVFDQRDNRIKVLHKRNGGLVSARKAGFEIATGRWIGFVDSDDWIEADMYEKLYYCVIDNNADIAMCGRYEDYDFCSKQVFQGVEEGIYRRAELENEIFPKMIVNSYFFEWGVFPSYWDKLFKKDLLEEYVLQVDDKITMGEDAACIYPCIYNAESIYVLKECLYHYRQSSDSMVRTVATDIKAEREKFRILFHMTRAQLGGDDGRYGLEEQWKKYVLFLMTPRADVLYNNLDKLEYLFPFPKVKRGDKIVIYGAGLWGKRLFNYLNKTRFCTVVAVVDKNYQNIRSEDFDVIAPEKIQDIQFDSIVITASYAKTRKAILDELKRRYPNEKIYGLDESEIFSDKTLVAFGLA